MALRRAFEILKRRFDDDSDVDSPLDFKYVSCLRLVMSSVGSWPYRQFGRPRLDAVLSLYNMLLLVLGITLISLATIYLLQHRETLSFFDMGHNLLCESFEIFFLQRLMLSRMYKYREVIRDYLLEFHLFYFKNRSKYAAKVHSLIHIASGMFTLYVMFQLVYGLILFMFMPWYNNYSRGMFGSQRPPNATFEHSVYYYLYTEAAYTTEKGYWVLFTFNIIVIYTTSIALCIFDLLLSLIVFQIWGHLRILKHNLLSMPLPSCPGGMYSVEENIQVRQLLKDNIQHHNFILKFVNKCSDAFSEYLFLFYLNMQFITCVLLLEVSSLTPDALAKYGCLTLGMFQQLLQVSILFEMLNTKSEQIIDAVYAMPWERMDAANRSTVLMLLQRVQSPVSLKAAKLVPVGVTTMSAVLKTTVSYYMMLNAVAGER